MEDSQILAVCDQLNIKLQEILNSIQTILKYLTKEKMNGFSDPKIVLASSLQALESDIIVWMHGYKDKADINKSACLYLAPASYKEQMEYIRKTYSEPDIASKLSDQLKKDISSLSELFDKLYQKEDLDRINSLNEAYADYIKDID